MTRANRTTVDETPPLEGNSIVLPLGVLGFVTAGALLWVAGSSSLADLAWGVAVILALLPLGISVARDLVHGETGVDLIPFSRWPVRWSSASTWRERWSG